jgi:peroxiredoxin
MILIIDRLLGKIIVFMNLQEQLLEYANTSANRIPKPALEIMKSAIKQLEISTANETFLKTGFILPNVTLMNHLGAAINLYDALQKSSLVITFYRGGWCPYCNLQLQAFQKHLTEIKDKGGRLIAITPEHVDHSLSTLEKNNLGFDILTDTNNTYAKSLNLSYKLPDNLVTLYKQFGIDLDKSQLNTKNELPISATYVIDQSGEVKYHFVAPDYKLRAPIEAVLNAL